jgi:probable HAF family extracellular repeat protein
MKSRFRMLLAAITFFAGLALLFAALALPLRLAAQDKQNRNQHRQARYAITVLGTLGGTFGYAGAINNRGNVAGNSTLTGDQVVHAFLWRKGLFTDLGTLGGPNSLTSNPANGVNDGGAVSGYSETSTPDPNGEDVCGIGTHLICLPFVWHRGVMTALPLLGGNNGQANEINNRGQIVGGAETPNPDPTCSLFFLQVEAVLWENGNVQELPPLPGDPDGIAGGINDKGQVAGTTGCGTGTLHAVLWPNGPNGGVIDLGNLGGTVNIAGDINNKTQVVGQADVPGGTHHAFLWQDGVMTDLGALPGLPTSFALSINNQGQVVGVSQDANGNNSSSVPFLWQNGVMTDLNTLIPPGSPLFLQEAESINDRGQIAGFGLLSNGEQRGFLLTPCDEEHANDEGCEEGENATGERPKVVLPENVRKFLQQRRGFGRFGLGR